MQTTIHPLPLLPRMMRQNNPLWEAIKFLLVLFLILLIATPQLVIAVLLLILTLHEVEQLRWENGLSKEGTNIMLNTWVHRHYIRRGSDSNDNYSNDSFEKLKFRRDGVEINDK